MKPLIDLAEIETPALVIDLDVMEANLASMAAFLMTYGIAQRPNIKGHKIPALAWPQLPGLNLVGVMGYEGHLYDLSGRNAVEDAARQSYETLTTVAKALRDAGIDVPRVSIGASAGARAAVTVSGITEVRAGSYLFNDRAQIQMGSAERATS